MKYEGVSIITCTNKKKFIENIFKNYNRQDYNKKELIIVLNENSMNFKKYQNEAQKYQNIKIYQLNQFFNLGHCLNLGIKKAKYDIIAKFDDDDYYGKNYINECMKTFNSIDTHIVGKYKFYIYFEDIKALTLRKNNSKNCYIHHIAGATISFKKEIFNRIKFDTQAKRGVDTRFIKDAFNKKLKIYSTSEKNFVAHRRSNLSEHTWKIPKEKLLKAFEIIAYVDNYENIVN